MEGVGMKVLLTGAAGHIGARITLWEKRSLDSMWAEGTAPWKIWS